MRWIVFANAALQLAYPRVYRRSIAGYAIVFECYDKDLTEECVCGMCDQGLICSNNKALHVSDKENDKALSDYKDALVISPSKLSQPQFLHSSTEWLGTGFVEVFPTLIDDNLKSFVGSKKVNLNLNLDAIPFCIWKFFKVNWSI